MAYTDIDKPSDYFETKLYAGNGVSGTEITGVGFQPNFTWIKNRSAGLSHVLSNSVSGNNKFLSSNGTAAESTDTAKFQIFLSDGFRVGSHSGVNASGNNYASWNWKETATAGFDIVSYTGNGSNPRTISHNLSAVPKMIIIKNRDQGTDWNIYHQAIGNDKTILLNTTNASFSSSVWNSTTPTSSVFSLGANDVNTDTKNYIAYCFAEKQGYSKFGSYTGNGSTDGTFVYLGFKPAFLIVKRTDATSNWRLWDSTRSTFNVADKLLFPDTSDQELTSSSYYMDLLSSGFKIRNTNADINASGGSYMYMAFAENPFVTSTGVPATAR